MVPQSLNHRLVTHTAVFPGIILQCLTLDPLGLQHGQQEQGPAVVQFKLRPFLLAQRCPKLLRQMPKAAWIVCAQLPILVLSIGRAHVVPVSDVLENVLEGLLLDCGEFEVAGMLQQVGDHGLVDGFAENLGEGLLGGRRPP